MSKTKTKPQDRTWLVPDLEVRVNESWIRLVRYCQTQLPFGEIRIKIVNAEPTKLIDSK